MNPVPLFRFRCTKVRRGGSTCNNTLDVLARREPDAITAALARGWESQGGDNFICDTCACVLTLCPVCKETKYRYGVDGTCSTFCAARKEAAIIDDEAGSIIAALKLEA